MATAGNEDNEYLLADRAPFTVTDHRVLSDPGTIDEIVRGPWASQIAVLHEVGLMFTGYAANCP